MVRGATDLLTMHRTHLLQQNEVLSSSYVKASFLIPYDRGNLVSYLNEHANVFDTEYLENGTLITVECSEHDAHRLAEYKVKPLNQLSGFFALVDLWITLSTKNGVICY